MQSFLTRVSIKMLQVPHSCTLVYWFINFKKNVDYKTTLIYRQPILDCMVPYLINAYTVSLYLQNESCLEVIYIPPSPQKNPKRAKWFTACQHAAYECDLISDCSEIRQFTQYVGPEEGGTPWIQSSIYDCIEQGRPGTAT